jgi:hypothetical protein
VPFEHGVSSDDVDLLSLLGIIAIGIIVVVGRMLLHRWQDRHWTEEQKSREASRDAAVREIGDARALGNALYSSPNIAGTDFTEGRGHGSGDLAP